MLRRISIFKKSKKDELGQSNGNTNGQVNGQSNGYSNGNANGQTNGHTNGHTNGKLTNGASNAGHPHASEQDHSATRSDVSSSLEQFAQVLHAARRPLPTQSGDGAYLDHEVPSGLLQDIKSLGFKDVNTLMNVMKTKATGELQDDKTMLMERVIQVLSPTCRFPDRANDTLSL